ncbi:MAG: hypothetical protein K2P57_03300 [Burkholderiales bacterium]|nr:hypothetical protein [Burkholderiales bacterium]
MKNWKAPGAMGWYFNNLLGEYRALPIDGKDTTAQAFREKADEILAKCPNITWADLYVFEIALLNLQPPELLRRKTWSMREKYRQIVGDEVYKKYEESKPPAPDTAADRELRIDLEFLLGKLNHYYSAVQQRDEMVSALMKVLGTIFFGAFSVIFLWFNFYSKYGLRLPEVPLILMVVFAGMSGAFASILQRIQNFKSQSFGQNENANMLSALDYGRLGVYFALISGAVFSTVLFLVFTAQILKGPFFPEIYTPKDNVSKGLPFSLFSAATNPADGIEYAKLLVWSFLAGFAERLVPDVLDRVAKKVQTDTTQAK